MRIHKTFEKPAVIPAWRRDSGFTLVEAVVAMVILGILSGIVAVFIVRPVEGYLASVRRAEMADAADTSMRRLAREIRTALPNSLRQSGTKCIEFLPIVGGGRYRESPLQDGTAGNQFNFTTAAGFTFDVLADSDVRALPAGTNHAVVYNLGVGLTGADAYASTGPVNKRVITGVAQANPGVTPLTVTVAAGNSVYQFPSPGRRFQVIPDFSVAYACTGSNLVRSTQPISATNSCPTPSGSISSSILATNVDCTNSNLTYTPGVLQSNGLLTATIVILRSGEQVQLYNEVHVNNVP